MYKFWLTSPQITNKNLMRAMKKITKNLLYEVNEVSFQKYNGEKGEKYEPQKVPNNDLDLAEKMAEKVDIFTMEVHGTGLITLDPSGILVTPEQLLICVGNYGAEQNGDVELEFEELEREVNNFKSEEQLDWWEWLLTNILLTNFDRVYRTVREAFVEGGD